MQTKQGRAKQINQQQSRSAKQDTLHHATLLRGANVKSLRAPPKSINICLGAVRHDFGGLKVAAPVNTCKARSDAARCSMRRVSATVIDAACAGEEPIFLKRKRISHWLADRRQQPCGLALRRLDFLPTFSDGRAGWAISCK